MINNVGIIKKTINDIISELKIGKKVNFEDYCKLKMLGIKQCDDKLIFINNLYQEIEQNTLDLFFAEIKKYNNFSSITVENKISFPFKNINDNINTYKYSDLDFKCDFSSLIVDINNIKPYIFLEKICNNSIEFQQLVIFYGKNVSCKSYFLNILGNIFFEKNITLKIKHIDITEIINKFYLNLKHHPEENEKIKQEILSYDCILIDDIQKINNKTVFSNFLYEIFSSFKKNNKYIFLTSNIYIDSFEKINNQLVSILSLAIKYELQQFDKYFIEKYLLFDVLHHNYQITDEMLKFIVNNTNNIFFAKGILNNIYVNLDKKNTEITSEFSYLLKKQSRKSVIYLDLINYIAEYYKINPTYIFSNTRKKIIVQVRNICIYLIYTKLNLSLKEIGKIFEKTHPLVIYAINYVKKLKQKNINIKNDIEFIESTYFQYNIYNE